MDISLWSGRRGCKTVNIQKNTFMETSWMLKKRLKNVYKVYLSLITLVDQRKS